MCISKNLKDSAIYIKSILINSFFGHPRDSLTPLAVVQIQCLISPLIFSYTTGSSQQLAGDHKHLLKTPTAIALRQVIQWIMATNSQERFPKKTFLGYCPKQPILPFPLAKLRQTKKRKQISDPPTPPVSYGNFY